MTDARIPLAGQTIYATNLVEQLHLCSAQIQFMTFTFPKTEVVIEATTSAILEDIKESYDMGLFDYNTLMLNLERVQGATINVLTTPTQCAINIS